MEIREIWRYPIKSMAGESLQTVELTEAGVSGDRLIQARNTAGCIVTARTRPLLLRHRGRLAPGDQVLVDERPWNSAGVAQDVEAATDPGTHLVESDPEYRFDILPLLIATDGMLAAAGYDHRCFRPNLVIGGVPGLSEREWEGARLRIGPATVGIEDLRDRCIMTTFDPDTGEQDLGVLRRVRQEFDGKLGLN